MIKVTFCGGPKDGHTVEVVTPAETYPVVVPAKESYDNTVMNYKYDKSRKLYIWETLKKWPI